MEDAPLPVDVNFVAHMVKIKISAVFGIND